MNWRRGLFRLWIVGAALFVLAVAFVSYSEIKAQFAAKHAASILAVDKNLADQIYRRFYSDMPREQFDKKINDPKLIARLEAITSKLDTSRPLSQWSDDELLAHYTVGPSRKEVPSPWTSLGQVAAIAFGIPLAILVLGSSLVWAFSGFAATRP
jgi:hypothetical protein